MEYNKVCCRSWLFKYASDRILKIAFDGSVSAAIKTCKSLAGLEYAEVATALQAAARVFEMSVLAAAKGLLGSGWDNAGIGVFLKENGPDSATLGDSTIKFKVDEHRRAVTGAYSLFAAIHAAVESVRSTDIATETELRQKFKQTFGNSENLCDKCLEQAQVLRRVAQRRIIDKAKQRKGDGEVEIPNGLVWAKIMFTSAKKGRGNVTIGVEEGVPAVPDVSVNEWHYFNPSWGFVFKASGSFDEIRLE